MSVLIGSIERLRSEYGNENIKILFSFSFLLVVVCYSPVSSRNDNIEDGGGGGDGGGNDDNIDNKSTFFPSFSGAHVFFLCDV